MTVPTDAVSRSRANAVRQSSAEGSPRCPAVEPRCRVNPRGPGALRHRPRPRSIRLIMGMCSRPDKAGPSRQAGLRAALPASVSSFTVNQVCASALKAVNLGALLIRAGDADVVVGRRHGGRCRVPRTLLEDQRFGSRFGDRVAVDSMMRDRPVLSRRRRAHGVHGATSRRASGSRVREQDAWAFRSAGSLPESLAAGKFADEIVPVSVNGSNGRARRAKPRADTTIEKLAALRGAFGDETRSPRAPARA